MVTNKELLQFSIELVRLICERESLERKLIINSAEIQDFETHLFRLCVLDFADQVHFFKNQEELANVISDDSYCDGVYSVVSDGIVTFYSHNGERLCKLVLNSLYEEVEYE